MIKRPRTSTIVLTIVFLGVLALYILVRPAQVTATVQPTGNQTAVPTYTPPAPSPARSYRPSSSPHPSRSAKASRSARPSPSATPSVSPSPSVSATPSPSPSAVSSSPGAAPTSSLP